MNHKDRFFTALELEEPDYVPITDLGLDPPIVQEILQKELESGLTFGDNILSLIGGSQTWANSINYKLALIEACRKLDLTLFLRYLIIHSPLKSINQNSLMISGSLISGEE